ncbi:RHS repeat-associated protein [Catenulispora sp. EB89]|uniref:RHS repeat-associated core domain-containing protein n=1 Tax=Catenulispora sp. EB89 TaxID=3156257 RepID=UPI00351156CD
MLKIPVSRNALLGPALAVSLTVPLYAAPGPVPTVRPSTPASVAAPAAAAPAIAAQASDVLVDGWGDSTGYHLDVADAAGSFSWREVALLRPGGVDAQSWTGYQCTSGDGRYEAVAVLPTAAANSASLLAHGAIAYSVDLVTGAVEPLISGVGFDYHSPGCGVGDTAVFTGYPGTGDRATAVSVVDLATSRVTRSGTEAEQLTSAVPTGDTVTAVRGSAMVRLSPHAGGFATPTVLTTASGVPFDLRPSSDGGVDFAVMAKGNTTAEVWHENNGTPHRLGQGPATSVALLAGRGGHNLASGVTPAAGSDVRALMTTGADKATPKTVPEAVSLDGDAVLSAPAGVRATAPMIAVSGHPATARPFPTGSEKVTTATPHTSPPPAQPHSTAATTTATAKATAAITPATSGTPACSVPRLDPARQVLQPDAAQVDWATQLDERGLETAARPAGYANLGLVSYSPSGDFPPVPLDHPAGSGTTAVPRSVMEAILAQESNWDQASWHALPGIAGDPLIADYYGSGGSIDTIDYSSADCGYGIAQVTDGMFAGQTDYSAHGQMKIAVDYAENIAAGLNILQNTWNQLYAAGITANNGDPRYLENWYFAIWAYNTGIQPTAAFGNPGCTPGPSCTGPDGTWGLGWSNNPANPNYPPNRAPFLEYSYGDAAHPGSWPYQERVLGWMGSPLLGAGGPKYAPATLNGGSSWLNVPPINTFCSAADDCSPGTGGGAGSCTLSDYECWWSAPATWLPNCASVCATSSYTVAAGTPEPSGSDPHPPTCNASSTDLPTTGSGAPIIVDDESSPPLNLVGCGGENWSDGGTFTYTYGTDSAGDQVGAIDTHQLGAGFGGRILFTHTEDGSETDLVNIGTWAPRLPKSQYYTIKVHVPATGAAVTDATYKVSTAGYGTYLAPLNQDQEREAWLTLGTVALAPGATVSLSNISGSQAGAYDVAFDAMAFLPQGGTPGVPIGGAPATAERPGGANPSWTQCLCSTRTAGDPVDTATGAYSDSFTDLSTPGRGLALDLTRTYDSALADPSGPNGAAAVNGPFGWGWTFSYGLSAATDPATGNVTVHQEDGSTVSFTDSSGSYAPTAPRDAATLVKSGSTYVLTRRATQIFTFDAASGRLLSETDPPGTQAVPPTATTLAYNASGQLTTITDPAGRTYTLGWTGSHISSLQDGAGREVTYAYDAAGDLTDVYGVATVRTPTLQNNDHATFAYSSSHLMTAYRAPTYYGDTTTSPSPVLTMAYDASDRVTSQTNPIGGTTSFRYGPSGSLVAGQTLTTDPAGHAELDTYTNGLLNSKVLGYGTASAATWAYTYDPVSLGVTTITDPTGAVQSFSYDASGNRISSADALGATTSYTYNAFGQVTTKTDPDGVQTAYGYDEAGHIATTGGTNSGSLVYGLLTSTTTHQTEQSAEPGAPAPPTPVVTGDYYDTAAHPGDLTRAVDGDGATTTTGYDAYGDVISLTTPVGDKTLYGYATATGLLTSAVSPLGSAAGTTTSCTPPATGCTVYGHDSLGDVTSATDPAGHVSTAGYDAAGRLTSTTDGAGNHIAYGYDPNNDQTTVTRADGSATHTAYNTDGSVASTTDASGGVTAYTYDAQGRQATVTDPDGAATADSYDAAGRPSTVTDPLGRVTTNAYDAAGRVTSTSYSGTGAPTVGYGYDAAGRRVRMTDGTGTSTWQYSLLGAVSAMTNGAGASVAYGYDADGNQTSITYPGGVGTVTQTFDPDDRLASVTDPSGRNTGFTYNADNALTATSYPNGDTVTDSYDATDALTGTALARAGSGGSGLASVAYTRNADELVLTSTPTGLAGGATTYQYDALNRVDQATTSAGTSGYSYTPAGGPNTLAGTAQRFDAAGRLCWSASPAPGGTPACASPPSGSTVYAYDSAGERTTRTDASGTVSHYGYNAAGEMTSASGSFGSAQYTYDGNGLRAGKTVGSTSESFTWGTGSTPNLLSDGTTAYLYGPGNLPIEQIGGGGAAQWFFHDALGSTVALTDGTGAVVGSFGYNPYGAVTATSGTATTPLGFGGQYGDSETGLVYLRARYYDPETAQFLTVDPDLKQTGQPYQYAGDDPVNALDPSGLFSWKTFGKIASAVSTAAAITLAVGIASGPIAAALATVAVVGGLTSAGVDFADGDYTGAVFDTAGALFGAGGYVEDATSEILEPVARLALGRTGTRLANVARGLRIGKAAEEAGAAGHALDNIGAAFAGGGLDIALHGSSEESAGDTGPKDLSRLECFAPAP